MVTHIGGSHILAIEASEDYENARDRVVEFINAREREEVIFTRNSTESMKLDCPTAMAFIM